MSNSTDPLNALFRDRTPEASARQLAIVLAWLTESQLATLESMIGRKTTPKGELERQKRICHDAVRQCADLGLQPGIRGLRGFPCGRLDDALRALATLASSLKTELAREDLQIYAAVKLAKADVERGDVDGALARLRVDADKLRCHDTPINAFLGGH